MDHNLYAFGKWLFEHNEGKSTNFESTTFEQEKNIKFQRRSPQLKE